MIGIVTDSSSDIPDHLLTRYRIQVVPLSIRFGASEHPGGLSPERFWEEMARSPSLPETAAPSAGAFARTYRRLIEDGADGVVAITLSSKMSATYQAAVIGAETQSTDVIRVVDSGSVSMGLGWVVIAAARAAATGAGLEEVCRVANQAVTRSTLFAGLDTLAFLQRGGRIGGAQAMLGSLLDIKPLIGVEDGVVTAMGKVRTRSKMIETLAGRVPPEAEVAVLHTGDPRPLSQHLAGETLAVTLGAVVGTHAGPGALGVAFLS